MSLSCLRQAGAGVEVFLCIQPRAGRNKLVGLQGEKLKVALTAPPVDGAANKACCLFMAKLCGLPGSRVRIISGETSRNKRLLLEGADIFQVESLVEDGLRG